MTERLVTLTAIALVALGLLTASRWLTRRLTPLARTHCKCGRYEVDEDIPAMYSRGIRHTHDECTPTNNPPHPNG
jgi:HAMP domain-containing protein